MKPEDIVEELHDLGDALDRQSTDWPTGGDTCYIAADLIKSLQAQLADSKRREQAALEDLQPHCTICKHLSGKSTNTGKCRE